MWNSFALKGLDGDNDDDLNKLESADGFKYCRLGRKEEIPVCQEGNELGSVEDLKDYREDSQGISNCQLDNDERPRRDLIDCQEGSGLFLYCEMGKGTKMRSAEDLKDCRGDSQKTLHCQLGDERRSGEDLEDCQEGSGSVLSCLEGRDEKSRLSESLLDSRESSIQQRLLMKMGSVDLIICRGSSNGSIPHGQMGGDDLRSQIQPGKLTEHISSQEDQQMKLTGEEEHQDDILMIGGIEIFLSFAQEEAENSAVHAATAKQPQLEMTVEEEELEQVSETAQVDEEENECSEEQLHKFSQQAERAAAFELTAKEIEEGNEHFKEWLDIFNTGAEETAMWGFAAEKEEGEHSVECLSVFSHEVENNAIQGVAETENEDTDSICLAELWEQIEALEDRVKVQGMHIQQVRLEIDEDGMGDHADQPHGQKILQLWRLQ
jgi:hypothetical protein